MAVDGEARDRRRGGRLQKWWNSYSLAATMVTYSLAFGAIMLMNGGEIEVAKFFAYPVLFANAPPVAMGMVLTALSLFLGVDIPKSELFWWWMAFAAPFVYPYWRLIESGWRRHLVKKLAAEVQAEANADSGARDDATEVTTPPPR